jgi:signal transduction histidine kinase
MMAATGGQIGQFLERKRAEAERSRLSAQLQRQLDNLVQLNAEFRRTAKERERALADLQELLQTRDELLSTTAHDLKNPLASIKAQAQLLERRATRAEGLDSARVVEGLQGIDASTTRMARLVNELLDTARLQLCQELDLDRRPVDIVRLTRQMVVEQQRTTDRHVIEVDATAAPSVVGDWDGPRLERVLTNLLENAVKYSPRGGTIRVSVSREDHGQRAWAVLTVRDEGVGIPIAEVPRVFERFRRGTNVVGRIGGTGIGLAGVHAIVEGHGGTISVDSREGVGSAFTVRLPLAAEAPTSS